MSRMSDSRYQTPVQRVSGQPQSAYSTGGAGFRRHVDQELGLAPNTSQQAATAAQENLNVNEQKVYDVLVQHSAGLTADQIAVRLDWHVTRVRPRLTGLRDKIRIKQTGETRKSDMGKASAVWVVLVGRS